MRKSDRSRDENRTGSRDRKRRIIMNRDTKWKRNEKRDRNRKRRENRNRKERI